MKKTAYLAPAIKMAQQETEHLICASVSGVEGDAGIPMGEGTAPGKADSRFNVWGDDEEEED